MIPISMPMSRVLGARPCCSWNRWIAYRATATSVISPPVILIKVASCRVSFGSINSSPFVVDDGDEFEFPDISQIKMKNATIAAISCISIIPLSIACVAKSPALIRGTVWKQRATAIVQNHQSRFSRYIWIDSFWNTSVLWIVFYVIPKTGIPV